MSAVVRQIQVGLKTPVPVSDRVGTRPSTECIEAYLRRAHDLFGVQKVARDVVVLLELFFFYKVGGNGNKINSAIQGVLAIVDFLAFARLPPWHWTPKILNEYLTHLAARDLARATICGRHHYIKQICDAILADRDIVNQLQIRYPDACFQQITTAASRALVRGYGKRKRKLANPTPKEMQQVLDYLESEIVEAIETGQPMPYVLLRDRTILAVLYAYGARLSELKNADVTDFDFDPQCPEYGDLGIWHIIGKGDKDRHLPILEPWLYPVLSAYIEQVRPHWTHHPKTPEKDRNALFFSSERKRLSATSIQRIVSQRFRQAGVRKRISPHRLRNACLTRVVDGIGLSQASRLAGHSFAATTEGYYDRKASIAGDALTNHVQRIYREQQNSKQDPPIERG